VVLAPICISPIFHQYILPGEQHSGGQQLVVPPAAVPAAAPVPAAPVPAADVPAPVPLPPQSELPGTLIAPLMDFSALLTCNLFFVLLVDKIDEQDLQRYRTCIDTSIAKDEPVLVMQERQQLAEQILNALPAPPQSENEQGDTKPPTADDPSRSTWSNWI